MTVIRQLNKIMEYITTCVEIESGTESTDNKSIYNYLSSEGVFQVNN